jgi:transposase
MLEVTKNPERWEEPMRMYAGIDLHSNNNYVAILDEGLKQVLCRRSRNDLDQVLGILEPYRDDIEAVAVESTFNWYWLVDGLMAAGYEMRLVNTTSAKNYDQMKYTDDRHDARWIAKMLALGILPEGYITPPEERGVRDLLRRRAFVVQKRTAFLLSMKTIYARSTGKQIATDEMQRWNRDDVFRVMGDEMVAESLASMLPIVHAMSREVHRIESRVLAECKVRDEFRLLMTVPGIGKVLTLTIMLETGDIRRFAKVGNYASYCRCVSSENRSNNKKKGAGNPKNGNKYLSWAFAEAAQYVTRYEPLARKYYDRKCSRSHVMVARRALANKLSRACFYILRDQVAFDRTKIFA